MNDMSTSNREYDNRGYDNHEYDYRDYRGSNNRGYDNRYYDEEDYRDYRDYRNYRDYDYRRDYDKRGGRINNRSYRNYRGDYYEELEMTMEDMKETGRKLEDIADMSKNMQEKNMLTKVAQKEKEHYMTLKQMVDKGM